MARDDGTERGKRRIRFACGLVMRLSDLQSTTVGHRSVGKLMATSWMKTECQKLSIVLALLLLDMNERWEGRTKIRETRKLGFGLALPGLWVPRVKVAHCGGPGHTHARRVPIAWSPSASELGANKAWQSHPAGLALPGLTTKDALPGCLLSCGRTGMHPC